MREALERLRPLAAEALLAVFGLAMTDAVDRAFGEAFPADATAPDKNV